MRDLFIGLHSSILKDDVSVGRGNSMIYSDVWHKYHE